MLYPPMEELLKQTGGSIYKLVILASTRVKELNAGAGRLVAVNPHIKLPIVALEEIRSGKVRLKNKK